MKIFSISLLLLASVVLTACNNDEGNTQPEGTWQPISCAKSADGCDTEWNFSFKRSGFPTKVAIYINDKKLIDQCNENGRWVGPNVEGNKIKFRLDNYSSIKKTDKISMRVQNLGERCDRQEDDSEYIYHASQSFEVSEYDNDSYVIIDA